MGSNWCWPRCFSLDLSSLSKLSVLQQRLLQTKKMRSVRHTTIYIMTWIFNRPWISVQGCLGDCKSYWDFILLVFITITNIWLVLWWILKGTVHFTPRLSLFNGFRATWYIWVGLKFISWTVCEKNCLFLKFDSIDFVRLFQNLDAMKRIRRFSSYTLFPNGFRIFLWLICCRQTSGWSYNIRWFSC